MGLVARKLLGKSCRHRVSACREQDQDNQCSRVGGASALSAATTRTPYVPYYNAKGPLVI